MSDIYKAPESSLRDPAAAGEYGSVEKALNGDYSLRPVEVIKSAWAMLPGLKLPFWIAAIIYGVVSMAFSLFQTGIAGDPAQGSVNWGLYLGISVLQVAATAPLGAGLMMIGIKHSVGAPVEFKEIFKHFDKTLNLFLTMVIMYVLLIIGFLLLILPGIYLAIAFSFAMPLVVEKNMGPWEALMTSRKAITHKWFNMLGFAVLAMLVVLAGVLALLVGLIWAYPLVVLAAGIIYRDMFGVEASTIADSSV
ncbi:hypothetical protein [Arenicella xantha]|uniref:Uncharacterized protein n=1 Tax=Arenicella xantha TaxID=644221 RepID=A0A395JHU9_9GAMM|nr:hypothetical protein [Arenicella xantha]RBP48300.1 hypothetical protein DFR28_10829 [Arenicella xantha]